MKYLIILILFCVFSSLSCKKDSRPTVIVTIAEKSGFGANLYAAIVENPDPAVHNFLCTLGTSDPKPIYNCTNAVYINNLPAALAVPGKKIKFANYKDNGQPLLFSSINHAHELAVTNPTEAN